MNNLEQLEVFIKSLESLAYEIAEQTRTIALSYKDIEKSYTEIDIKDLTIASPIDGSGVLQFGLIDKILQREVRVLFETLETLKQSLLVSTRSMIKTTIAALDRAGIDIQADYKCRLEKPRLALFESLYDLKKIEFLLCAISFLPPQNK